MTTARILLVIIILGAGLAAAADRPSYTMDTDPVRLGNKAFGREQLDEARSHYEEAIANDYHLPEAFLGLARVCAREGKYTAAEARYRQALAAGGNDPEANAGLGLILLRLGDPDGAARQFDLALAADSKLWTAHFGRARLHIAAGDWQAARAELDRGKGRKGLAKGEDLYRYGTALLLQGTGDADGALTEALRATTINPADPDYVTLVAQLYAAQGTTSLAINTYEQALATPGMATTAPLLHELGRLYADERRFNEASDRYLQAVALDSTYTPALKDLADLYQRAHRFDLAARTYLRYVELAPADADAHVKLAESLSELGRWSESLKAAQRARELEPDRVAARVAFARAGLHSGDEKILADAARTMVALPDSLPWQAEDLVQLGAWQTSQRDWPAARTTLARAAALDPALPSVPFQQGLVEMRAGDAGAAVGHFERAVELGPDSANNQLNLGIALYQAGRIDEAIPAFRQAVALREDLTLGRLLLAQALAATDALADAQREYERVLEREANNAKALRGIGFCRIRQADYAGAAAVYERATGAEPDNADGWAGLGSAYLGLGRLAAAEATFARARAIDPTNVMMIKGTELLNQARSTGKESTPR